MSAEFTTESKNLRKSARFQRAKKELVDSILESTQEIREVKAGTDHPDARMAYQNLIREFVRDRGRDLYFQLLLSGLGSGPLVELMDGSVKYDMITGIGINFFGHSYSALIEEMVEGLPSNVMQGNLEPGLEVKELLSAILARVGVGSRLVHGWTMCSGTMVNEVALKIIRQKKSPATRILAFQDCFAGRSTAMQEITDNPSYRQGQPLYGEVSYLPFYDGRRGLQSSIEATLSSMEDILRRYPGRFATLLIELVQGEGGFQYAPREFYVRVFEYARKAQLAIWVDEIQTFGRTGELFAYQKFSLHEYVDVVTIGKMLQSCMVLFTAEYNPKPGLVAGTFSGSTAALRTGRRVLEILDEGKFLGRDGKIEKLSRYFMGRLEHLMSHSCQSLIAEVRGIGGMIAFLPFDGTMDDIKSVLMRLFDLGVIAFYCGHGPFLIRFLPPLGVMAERDIDRVTQLIEQALLDESKSRLLLELRKNEGA